MIIISKQEARKLGLKRYFTGKPCKNGHTAERSASTNRCCECTRNTHSRRKEKRKDYYRENKDSIIANQARYYERNKEKIKASAREFYYKSKERKENKQSLNKKTEM